MMKMIDEPELIDHLLVLQIAALWQRYAHEGDQKATPKPAPQTPPGQAKASRACAPSAALPARTAMKRTIDIAEGKPIQRQGPC
jgi:hypothetical protein